MEPEKQSPQPKPGGEEDAAGSVWHRESRMKRLAARACDCGGVVGCLSCADRSPRLVEVETIVCSPTLWAESPESRDPTWEPETIAAGLVFAQHVRG